MTNLSKKRIIIWLIFVALLSLTLFSLFKFVFKKQHDERINDRNIDKVVWWKKTNFYHIYIRSFKDSDGDGQGDLRGIINSLDYLQWLGIETILLSPFYSSPMKDGGYDIDNYLVVNPRFGTLADAEELFKFAHDRNMRVVVDFVPNHTSNLHKWFKCSERALIDDTCKRYKDYYVWSNGKQSSPPNNWKSQFGNNSAWTYSKVRDQYYYHQFLAEQPDLNFREPLVREEFKDIARFWLSKGADGLRIDAAIYILEDIQLRDEPQDPAYRKEDVPYNQLMHVYTQEFYDSGRIIHDWHSVASEDQFRDRQPVIIGELYAKTATLLQSYGSSPSWRNTDMPFNFVFFKLTKSNILKPKFVAELMREWLASVASLHWPTISGARDPWTNWVLDNHDNSRLVNRVGKSNAKTLTWLSFLALGSPVAYYGNEISMPDIDISKVSEQTKKEGESSRLGPRGIMAWTGEEPSAGFSSSNKTWLPPPNNYKSNNIELLSNDIKVNGKKNELSDFINLIKIRKQYIETIVFGSTFFYANEPSDESPVFAMARVYDFDSNDDETKNANLLVLANFDPSKPQTIVSLKPINDVSDQYDAEDNEDLKPNYKIPIKGKILLTNCCPDKDIDSSAFSEDQLVDIKNLSLFPMQAIVLKITQFETIPALN